MILSCNSCGKKFVVPDSAITASGRMVQCGSCGNKWKQFPIEEVKKTQSVSRPQKAVSKTQPIRQKIQKPKKVKKTTPKKPREISLYSPEYLAKKHGIKLNENINDKRKNFENREKSNFGFYNSLIILLIFIIFFLRILYFTQDIIAQYLPQKIVEFYLYIFLFFLLGKA